MVWYESCAASCTIEKIAQGSYGGVLRIYCKHRNEYVIGKLMPLLPTTGPGTKRQDQTLATNAASELQIFDCMQECQGFIDFRSATILKGPLPRKVKDMYKDWNQQHAGDPGFQKTIINFAKDQYWLFLEMDDAGKDIESVVNDRIRRVRADPSMQHLQADNEVLHAKETWDIFWQVAVALAIAEARSGFEHRDLHPGNVCIKPTLSGEPVSINWSDKPIEMYSNNEVTIIDYTLSRARLPDGTIISNPMQDPAQFTGYGDLQYEVYRDMRTIVDVRRRMHPLTDPEAWQDFVPMTNVLWLHFLLRGMLQHTIHDDSEPQEDKQLNKELAEALMDVKSKINHEATSNLDVLSARDLCDLFVVGELDLDVEEVEGEGLGMKQARKKRKTRTARAAARAARQRAGGG